MQDEDRLLSIYRALSPYLRALLMGFAEMCWNRRERYLNVFHIKNR